MNIIECFISVQGEGLRAGRPSLFIRTSGCNLRCVFHNEDGKASSTCDTSYASFNPTNEKKQVALDFAEIILLIDKYFLLK